MPDCEPSQLLDIPKISSFLVAAQRNRDAGRTRARRSADAVNVVFGNVRQLEVDDVRHAFHIDTPRGEIGRDEDPAPASSETGERAFALGLRFVSVDGGRLDTGPAQMPYDPVRTVFCAGENEHPFECRIPQQCGEDLSFPITRNEEDPLIYPLDRCCRWRHGHLDRVIEVLLGQ